MTKWTEAGEERDPRWQCTDFMDGAQVFQTCISAQWPVVYYICMYVVCVFAVPGKLKVQQVLVGSWSLYV